MQNSSAGLQCVAMLQTFFGWGIKRFIKLNKSNEFYKLNDLDELHFSFHICTYVYLWREKVTNTYENNRKKVYVNARFVRGIHEEQLNCEVWVEDKTKKSKT